MDTLFLSHYSGDHKVAAALKQLVESCFPGHIHVNHSSAAPSDGGIAMGSEWLPWVHEKVRTSKFTAVVLTPHSLSRPWLMWEAGAVSGVALATRDVSLVIPIIYRLSTEQIPSPLKSRHAADGEDGESITRVLETLREETQLPLKAFERHIREYVPEYLESVAQALADSSPSLTQSAEIEKPRFPQFMGGWRSRYVKAAYVNHCAVIDDVEVRESKAGIIIQSQSNSSAISYSAEGTIYRQQVMGEWRHSEGTSFIEGLFVLAINARADVMYGYCTARDENDAMVFETWVLVKKADRTESEIADLLLWGENALRERTLSVPLQ